MSSAALQSSTRTTESPDHSLGDQTEPEHIAPLVSIVSSIFVPLEHSLLESTDEPRDRLGRLELMLQRTDSYSESVKRNIMYMFSREKDRLQRLAAETTPPEESTMSQDEFSMMLRNVKASTKSSEDYGAPRPLVQMEQDEASRLFRFPQDTLVEELMKIVNTGAVQQIDGFDGMVEEIKKEYRQAIEKERATEARLEQKKS